MLKFFCFQATSRLCRPARGVITVLKRLISLANDERWVSYIIQDVYSTLTTVFRDFVYGRTYCCWVIFLMLHMYWTQTNKPKLSACLDITRGKRQKKVFFPLDNLCESNAWWRSEGLKCCYTNKIKNPTVSETVCRSSSLCLLIWVNQSFNTAVFLSFNSVVLKDRNKVIRMVSAICSDTELAWRYIWGGSKRLRVHDIQKLGTSPVWHWSVKRLSHQLNSLRADTTEL